MNSITVTRNVLDVLGEVVAAYIAVMTLNYLFIRQDVGVAVVAALLMISAVTHFMRDNAKNKKTIWSTSAALAMIMGFFPVHPMFRYVLVADVFIQIGMSLHYFDNQKQMMKVKEKIVLFAVITGMSYVFCLVMHNSEYLMRLTIAVILLIILIAVEHYFEGMAEYIECSKEYRGISVKGMLGANIITMLSVSVIMVVIILVCDYLDILGIIYRGLRWLLYFLLSLISVEEGKFVYDPMRWEMPPVKDGETDILDKLIIAVCVCVVLICIYGMVQIIMAILGRTSTTGDQVERIKDIEEVLVKEKRKSRFQKMLDPREKVRKYYRKKLRFYQHDIALNSYQSCGELEQAVKDNAQENVEELTRLYERVRYSDDKVTNDMIKQAKKLSQKS